MTELWVMSITGLVLIGAGVAGYYRITRDDDGPEDKPFNINDLERWDKGDGR